MLIGFTAARPVRRAITRRGTKMKKLKGNEIRCMMRKNKKTIAGLAKEWNITQKRINEVREKGISGDFPVDEWIRLITGEWPESL